MVFPQWQFNYEDGAVQALSDADSPIKVILHNNTGHVQTNSCTLTLFLGGEIRVEYPGVQPGGNSAAIVLDVDDYTITFTN
jgi:hypothetical protein